MRERLPGGIADFVKTFILFGPLVLQGISARAEAPARPALDTEVLPLLKARCIKCHGPLKPKAKLTLSSPRAIARGGENGPIVAPGKLDESAIWEQVSEDLMPPKPEDPLTADEKGLIKQWIEQGAVGLPSIEQAKQGSPGSDHWAFAKLTDPVPPSPVDSSRVRTPIDRFIQKALEERGVSRGLSPDADRRTLIRRVALNLTGLPPSPQEAAAFLNDKAEDAYEAMVDRYLASPRYGERWGKLWLDASGYTDSNGYFNADSDRPLAYRYRDYIVRAFNSDRPLDRVVREQIAGDEISGYRPGVHVTQEIIDQLTATHFLRNGQDGTGESDGNPDELRADRYSVLEGAIQIIGSSLLGLTTQCAKCHDHKFEPISQKEYYQLQAILYPAFNVENWVKPQARIVVAGLREVMAPWEAHEKPIDEQIARLKADFEAKKTGPDIPKDKEALDKAIKELEAKRLPNPGRIAWVADISAKPPEVPLLLRGNPATPGPKVDAGVPAVLCDPDNPFDPKPPFPGAESTGRRLAFANWLTKPGSRPSALLARVLANRIWQDHFGVGLVATSENLGYTGSPPSHPELLEYLAGLLVQSGWSAKTLHRAILRSTAYRQSSTPRDDARTADPDNRYLSHAPLRRLDAEQVRDAMLFASGELDDRQGGPYVPTHRGSSGEVTVNDSHEGARRRTIYLQQRRTQIASLLEVFDAPSIVTACPRRVPATIPLQSLSLLNSDFAVKRARRLAERIEQEAGVDAAHFVDHAFMVAVGRDPRSEERFASLRFLAGQPANYEGVSSDEAQRRARADLCQMILASNSFLYIE
jgi:hypothetical protein